MKYLCWMAIVVCIAAMIAWSCTTIEINTSGDVNVTVETGLDTGDIVPMK